MIKIKDHILTPLIHIFNNSLQQSIFPENFKSSLIKPLFKSGEKTKINNYRPIALTSNLAKSLEKIVKKRLMIFLEQHNVLSPNQFGFRQGRGTQDALFTLSSEISHAIENGEKCITVFLDLAKAFDTVSHPILLKKLEALGIRGNANNWFETYLRGRKQKVVLGEHKSEELVTRYSVPQGTVLGPPLYLVYSNELCNLPLKGKTIAFADDTAIIFKGKTWEEVFTTAENELRKVTKWLNDNLLTLNIQKTKFVAFSLTQSGLPIQNSISLHSCQLNMPIPCTCPKIERTPTITYLGVDMDEKLTWEPHCQKLTTRLRKLIHKFVQLREILDPKALKAVYYALVESLISYGIIIWGGAASITVDPVYKVQKLLLRVMNRKHPLYPSELLYRECEVLNIRQTFIYKAVIHLHTNPNIHQRRLHTHSTRIRDTQLLLPKVNKTFTQRQANYAATKVYNQLPAEIKQHTRFRFKKELQIWLINRGINDIDQIAFGHLQ